jgi:hypothetical protein
MTSFEIWELVTLIYVCILSRPVLLYPLDCYVIEGPIKLLGYLSAWLTQVLVLVLYIQCVFALTACFIFRYQLAGSTGSQSFNWRPLFALALYCKKIRFFKGQSCTLASLKHTISNLNVRQKLTKMRRRGENDL